MRKFLLIGILFISGCVSVGYNAKTGDLSYSRVGPQSLKNIEIETPDGGKLKIGSQESNPTELLREGIELGKSLVSPKSVE